MSEHPALANARAAIEEEERERRCRAESAAGLVWRALVLSPSLEVCRALLAGELVPVSRLDPDWARRFGLR